ncbi:hypothetical protein GPECTOR_99g817 [Gonium pectorale]|uniref:Uncharacterized protein n=1 Tax=Gonium pectorale TaxID=33097 RepID=A0A150G005_GONPE|nr:hypothetical protein GPECTOR_99g817 [Gonium pectorale]|eukprot:KXZ43182.1 hypothetical protein GPECTOR_99g817 [Gonium pectorale]
MRGHSPGPAGGAAAPGIVGAAGAASPGPNGGVGTGVGAPAASVAEEPDVWETDAEYATNLHMRGLDNSEIHARDYQVADPPMENPEAARLRASGTLVSTAGGTSVKPVNEFSPTFLNMCPVGIFLYGAALVVVRAAPPAGQTHVLRASHYATKYQTKKIQLGTMEKLARAGESIGAYTWRQAGGEPPTRLNQDGGLHNLSITVMQSTTTLSIGLAMANYLLHGYATFVKSSFAALAAMYQVAKLSPKQAAKVYPLAVAAGGRAVRHLARPAQIWDDLRERAVAG